MENSVIKMSLKDGPFTTANSPICLPDADFQLSDIFTDMALYAGRDKQQEMDMIGHYDILQKSEGWIEV